MTSQRIFNTNKIAKNVNSVHPTLEIYTDKTMIQQSIYVPLFYTPTCIFNTLIFVLFPVMLFWRQLWIYCVFHAAYAYSETCWRLSILWQICA